MAAENNIVGEVGLLVKPIDPNAQFQRGVDELIRKLEKQAQFQVKAAGLDDMQSQVNGVGSAFANAAVQAAGYTAAVFGVQRAIEGVINKFSGLFDGLAKARAGFTSILGSADKANALLGEVRQFAIESPFVTSELVSYSQQLLGVGKAASTIVPTLKNVGDIVASVGGDTSNLGSILYALTQIQTIGKLTGQDARQLQNQLVPITKYIAEYTKTSVADVKKLQEAGGISADVVFAALKNQGAKVEGAMNASVRTIQGAKSVLSDTITAMFQSNEGLSGIFDDIVAGIQLVAAKLSEPAVLSQINGAIDSVVAAYEALKPVAEGFAKFGALTGLSFLSTFTTILSTFADVIGDFPTGFLEAIGTVLAALAILKAPLALIKYAESLTGVARGLLGTAANGVKANATLATNATVTKTAAAATTKLAIAEAEVAAATQAANVASARQVLGLEAEAAAATAAAGANEKLSLARRAGQFVAKNSSKIADVASVAAIIGGQAISQKASKTNTTAQAAGSALTYGGIGYQVGGVYGAVAGAAIGAVTGYLNAAKEKFKKQVAEMEELGKKNATAFLNANAKAFETATPESAKLVGAQYDTLKAKIEETKTAGIDLVKAKGLDALDDGSGLEKLVLDGKKLTAEQEALKATYDAIVVPIQDAARAAAEFNQEAFTNGIEGDRGARAIKSFDELDASFRQYGVTTTDVVSMGAAKFAELVEQIEKMDTAQKAAVISANLLATAIKDQTGNVSAIYDSQISNIGAQVTALTSLDSARKAAGQAATAPGDPLLQDQATAALFGAQKAAEIVARGNAQIEVENKITAAKKAGNDVEAKRLLDTKDATVAEAGETAALAVATAATKARTKAVIEYNFARDKQRTADENARQAAVGTVAASTRAAGFGAANAIISGDPIAVLQAQSAATAAAVAAGNAAATAASATLRRNREDLISGGTAVDSITIEALDAQIRTTEETARTTAETKTLMEIEKVAAFARKNYNRDAVEFLVNLQEGARLSAILFGPQKQVADSIVSAYGAIDAASDAVQASLTGTTTGLEKAQLESAALAAKTSQFNQVYAETGSTMLAAAAATKIYNEVIDAATGNIVKEVGAVVALNKNLDSIDGRNAVVTVTMLGIDESLTKIGELQRQRASVLGDKNIPQAEREAILHDLDKQIAAEQHLVDIRTGKVPDDVGVGKKDSAAAQALIQADLDKTAADKLKDWQKSVDEATKSLTSKVQAAADAIAAAADRWVSSIKERTQYEQAVSVGRLTRNADRQVADLKELGSGLTNLRSRGVTDEVLKALGIDNVADVKQVRKLVKASDADLAKLSSSVSGINTEAAAIALSEEDKRTRDNITKAIIEAATTLGIDKPNEAQASGLAAQFIITPGMNADEVVVQIMSALTAGRVG